MNFNYIENALFFFCGGHFEFLIRARSASARPGTGIIILGERSDPPRICEFSNPPKTSVISVPDLALADFVIKIQNGRHKTQSTRDKGRLIFYSCSIRNEGSLCAYLVIMNTQTVFLPVSYLTLSYRWLNLYIILPVFLAIFYVEC